MPTYREALTPATLAMLQIIAQEGSFAAAARVLNMVPSALTYRVRQVEEALDVLLFDRRSRQAQLTAAGEELLREGRKLLAEVDAIAHRVRRVATGWETALTLAVDSIIDRSTLFELCEQFFALHAPTRLRIRSETLSGTLAALTGGQADLALGVSTDRLTDPGLGRASLGYVGFVFAVAPHHPLADLSEPLSDTDIAAHRAVAIADSNLYEPGISFGLLDGQQVFTVPDMAAKVAAQMRGLGVGFLPLSVAQPHLTRGQLRAKTVARQTPPLPFSYVWRQDLHPGHALQWWLQQLEKPVTRQALLGIRPSSNKEQ